VIQVREILESETELAGAAMLELRPRRDTAAAVVAFIDNYLRPAGYRLVGAFDGERLMDWLDQEAAHLGCEALHLDSGVAADRAPAHRLYMRHKLHISAHHFEREI
jgi:hypothetical protein